MAVSPRRLPTTSWLPLLITALTAAGVLVSCDVPVADVAVYALYLGLGVALPGVVTWRMLLRGLHHDEDRRPTWFEDLSLGTILGFGVQLPFFLLGVAVGVPLLVLAFPVLALVLVVTPLGREVWSLPTDRVDPGVAWGLAAVSVYGLLWLRHNLFPLRPLSLPANRAAGVDESFHQALVADIANRFPPETPFLLDTRLDYHWFVHGQIATSRFLTGVDTVTMLRLVLPAALLLLIVAGLGAVALRLAERPVAAVIAPALLVIGAFHLLGPEYPAHLFTEPFLSRRYVSSPSQTYGVMMSMPALMLILEVLRPERRASRGVWVALGLALLALSGSKATFLPIFLCGAVGAWGVRLLLLRRIDRAASGLVVLIVAATAFAQFVIFGGSTGSLSLDPFQTVRAALDSQDLRLTPRNELAMTGTLLTGWLLYGVGAVGLLARRRWLDARAVFMLVCVPAGITVALLFFRSGVAQMWFQRSVAELVVVLSAWGLSYLLPRPLTPRDALRLTGVAAVAGLSAYAVSAFVGAQKPGPLASFPGLVLTAVTPFAVVGAYVALRLVTARAGRGRWAPGPLVLLAFLLGLASANVFQLAYELVTGSRTVHSSGYPEQFAKGGVAAAEYVEKHSDADAVVATNMHCSRPHADRCDNRHFWLSAYSERRIVIEGWGYSAPANALAGLGVAAFAPVPFPGRLETNDAAFRQPSAATVGTLVDTYDVEWLVVSKRYPADVEGLRALDSELTHAFENSNYVVFKVR